MNVKLSKWQLGCLRSPALKRVALLSRAAGKSFAIAAMMLKDLAEGCEVMLAAPTHAQGLDTIQQLQRLCGEQIPFHRTLGSYKIANGSLYRVSAQRPDLVRGKNVHRLYGDEAAFMSEYFVKGVLMPCVRLVDKPLQMTFVSSPLDSSNWLSKEVLSPSKESEIFRGTYKDNPFISTKIMELLEEEYALGNELLMRRELRGEIVDFSSDSLFSTRIESLQHTRQTLEGEWIQIGLDVAQGGDWTVAVVANEKSEIMDIVKRKTPDIEDVKQFAFEMSVRFNPDEIRYDSSGAGKWIDSVLKSRCSNVVGVNFGTTSDKRYDTARSKMYYEAYKMMDKKIAVHCDPAVLVELKNDLLAHSLIDSDNKGGRIAMLPKDKVKAQIGRSPDVGDAFCLALMKTSKKGFEVDTGYF